MAHPKPIPTSSTTVYQIPYLPPSPFMLRLVGKSNYNLWLTSIKPFLFCHPATTGLILGGWPEPVVESRIPVQGTRGKVRHGKPIRGAFNYHVPSSRTVSSRAHIDNWNHANRRVCQFIRGTLGPSVLSFVSHHYNARALWLYLDWLYGESSGIDTLVGAPIPVWTEEEEEESEQVRTMTMGVAGMHNSRIMSKDENNNPEEEELKKDDIGIDNNRPVTSSSQSHNDGYFSSSKTRLPRRLHQEQSSTPESTTTTTTNTGKLGKTPLTTPTTPRLLFPATISAIEVHRKPVSGLVHQNIHLTPTSSQHKNHLTEPGLDGAQTLALLPNPSDRQPLSPQSQPRLQTSWDHRNLDTIDEEPDTFTRPEVSKKRFGIIAARTAKGSGLRRRSTTEALGESGGESGGRGGGGISDRCRPDSAKTSSAPDHYPHPHSYPVEWGQDPGDSQSHDISVASIRSEKRKALLYGTGDLIKEKLRDLGFGNAFGLGLGPGLGLGQLDGLLRLEEHAKQGEVKMYTT
ncbi:hypothetical protein PV10_01759 [Exophiala mesophila]|uniref:Uncharacterized protein n=1 Tax=Exophiala mesophila TaxID=212818 RepID=A0A0D1ZVQ8_EXOME|nr:uncharacterized protein PV10_01759 [Exophiala mesophila]KIV98069.1 hypothetical protein PV10_01759 [Exophiala mesophila]